MNNIPALCIDDFYSDPDSVRALALKQEYSVPVEGTYPGKRTKRLDELDRNFFNQFCNKLLSVFFDLDSESISYEIDTSFQLIQCLQRIWVGFIMMKMLFLPELFS